MMNTGGQTEVVDVVGSLCENNDKFAVNRKIYLKQENSHCWVIHDTGAIVRCQTSVQQILYTVVVHG